MASTFSSDGTAPFFGFLGTSAAYGTAKSSVDVETVGVMRPERVMKSIVPVVMAEVLRIYGLITAIIISIWINPKAKPYFLFDGYAHLSSRLARDLNGLTVGMAISILGDAGVRLSRWKSGDHNALIDGGGQFKVMWAVLYAPWMDLLPSPCFKEATAGFPTAVTPKVQLP